MNISVKYNDIELDKYMIVNDIRRGIGAPRANTLQKMGMAHGESFIGATRDALIYEMEFTLLYDVLDKRRELASILNVDEPKMLIFGDEPSLACLAIPDGTIDVEEKMFHGVGTITWVIPSGFSFALNTRKFTASMSADNILSMEVDNRGTVETPLSVRAEIKDDNGYFGIVGPKTAMEFGKRDESDGHHYQQSDRVANNSLRPNDEKNWQVNSDKANTQYPVAVSGVKNRFGEGTFSWAGEGPQPTFPSNTANCWVGPTLYREFGKNSNGSNTGNFEASWRCNFATKNVKEQMREEFNLMDDKGNVIFAVVLRDSTPSKKEMKGEMMALLPDDSLLKETFTVDLKKANGTWYDIKVSRIGSTITFKVANIKKLGSDAFNVKEARWQTTKSLNVPELKDTPITATTYWVMANYGGRDKTPVLKESLTNFTFRWINVAKYSDDPNRYMNGDTLFYNSDTGKYFVNDILTMNDIVQGSIDIMIPPGKHTVEFYYSDFCEIPPVVTAEIRERWL